MVVALSMGWRHLLFENYPVAPDVVQTHLPDGLTVDTHDGQAYLSVVPFTNVAVRPKGLPSQLGTALPELNVRTYVTCNGTPGVYFFSLDAQGIAGVLGARLLHHLPYYYARISLSVEAGRIDFSSRRRQAGDRAALYDVSYRPTGDSFAATEDPLAEFLVERYRLFAQASDGSIRYTAVDHEPWTLYPATVEKQRDTMLSANGFGEPETEPIVHYSPGLDVVASPSRRVDSPQSP